MLLLFADSLIYRDFVKPIIEVTTLIFLGYTFLSQRNTMKIQRDHIEIQKNEISKNDKKTHDNLLKTKIAMKDIIDSIILKGLREVKDDYKTVEKGIQNASFGIVEYALLNPLEIKISKVFEKTEIVDIFKTTNSLSISMLYSAESAIDMIIKDSPLELFSSFALKFKDADYQNTRDIQVVKKEVKVLFSINVKHRINSVDYAITTFEKISKQLEES